MALTPEDVVNKQFQPTKFREGYDQEEVDDFLDDVVAELRRLNEENDGLRSKLSAAEARISELTRAAGEQGTTEEKAIEPAPAYAEPVAAEPEPAPAAAPAPAPVPVAATPATSEAEGATGMLALAQKLHDEHIREGEERRDQIIAEAQGHAEKIVQDAEEQKRQTIGALEQQRNVLERKLDELRTFERDYRSRLKSYLEDQLRDLGAMSSVVPGRTGDSASSGASRYQGFGSN